MAYPVVEEDAPWTWTSEEEEAEGCLVEPVEIHQMVAVGRVVEADDPSVVQE